ncbi:NAD(P)-dependent oxidoreductase [Rhodococcoides fascians A21d2]|uniref:NAD-dependent epimerase/dehydratase family protein n=1 Tax=Rhodococcoides fascians TaxID=1828 RepID=UPI000564C256|nr:NAD(P)-dependent oxidoreductase [Rhodococcus fascians]QII00314.1 NAD(P)-dependent oxidoreductase [Rhodococcus fascians A21d2]
MKVLITGGLGVNGSWVARRLIEKGHDVVILDAHTETTLISDVVDAVAVVTADVADSDQVHRVFAEYSPDSVIHMAAIIGADRDPVAAVRVNVGGTAAVCDAAVRAGIPRVIYTSSRAVYGTLSGEHAHPYYVPVTEDHPHKPVNLYDVTKSSCEELGRWYRRRHSLEFVSLRFATIYGPGKLQRHGGFGAYSSLVELPAAGKPVHLPKGGEQRDDVIYVLDAADAVVAAALAPDPLPHDAYNIGTSATVSLNDLADAVRRAVVGASIDIGPGLDPMDLGASYYGALDSSRAQTELGWEPQFDVDAGVAHYLQTLERLHLTASR